jgi:uncharacterized membrane protein YeaQ/YmgE (transglycosylase-associated protein family)
MGVISWFILGTVAGVAVTYYSEDRLGYVADIMIGIIGAMAGGFSANLVMRLPVFWLQFRQLFRRYTWCLGVSLPGKRNEAPQSLNGKAG